MNSPLSLVDELPVLRRLALSYAPASARAPWLAYLALDARLAAILRAAREPMLAQLRFAWWREQLKTTPTSWPTGEPLLAALTSWGGDALVLGGLVDGWEAMTGAAPLPPAALTSLAEERGAALGALAGLLGAEAHRGAAVRLGVNWALADLAAHLGHPDERGAALALAQARDWRGAALPRKLRPLIVLHGLAERTMRGGGPDDSADSDGSPLTLLAAMRLGLLGR